MTAPLPFLYTMRESRVFFAVCTLAICTSLASAILVLFAACERMPKRATKNAAKAVSLLAAFACSTVGLSNIVAYVYPPIGEFGLLFLAFCIFHEKFFQKHDQKVHSRRQNAENTGGAHDQIKLKYLPAVHD